MTRDSQENLLLAYRAAVAGNMSGIADLLEKVILAEMCSSAIPATRGIKVGDNPLEPPWKVTCGPDVVPLGGMTVTTDYLGKEETI